MPNLNKIGYELSYEVRLDTRVFSMGYNPVLVAAKIKGGSGKYYGRYTTNFGERGPTEAVQTGRGIKLTIPDTAEFTVEDILRDIDGELATLKLNRS